MDHFQEMRDCPFDGCSRVLKPKEQSRHHFQKNHLKKSHFNLKQAYCYEYLSENLPPESEYSEDQDGTQEDQHEEAADIEEDPGAENTNEDNLENFTIT